VNRTAITVRTASAADLPELQAWLRPGAARELPASDDDTWLVAERGGHLQGCVRLRAAIGLDLPRPWYHVGCVVHAAAELGLHRRQHTLLLGNDYTGASELADLTVAPGLASSAQASVQQRLLRMALARVAADRGRFAPRLIVELPGLRDEQGRSPFWQGLGAPFYAGDPLAAAQRFGPAWKSHVAALLPRQPVYTAFLPDAARDAIAQVDPAARGLLQVLWDEGLRYDHHVAIDDGGPVFAAVLDALPRVNARRQPRTQST